MLFWFWCVCMRDPYETVTSSRCHQHSRLPFCNLAVSSPRECPSCLSSLCAGAHSVSIQEPVPAAAPPPPPPHSNPSFPSSSSSSSSSSSLFAPLSSERWAGERSPQRASAPNRYARIPPRTDLPLDTQPPFVWRRGSLTPCSASCGKGQTRPLPSAPDADAE